MPDPGRARSQSYLVEIPAAHAEYPALPWKCEGVTMLNVYFEVRKEALLERLPGEFNRTSPAYCRLFIIDHPQSPVGPFREATLALGCRFNMMPGTFAAASITDNPKVYAAGLLERGFPNVLGKIEFEASAEQARAAISDSKGVVLTVVMPALQTIEPSRLAYDHVDAFRTVGKNGSSRAELVVTSPDVEIASAAICKNARLEYPVEREGAWHALRSRNLISAQLVRGTRTLAAGHKP